VDWSDLPGSGGGEINTASNVGVGQGVWKDKVSSDLRFYSISGGTNVTTTLNGDTIVLDATGGGGSSRVTSSVQTTNATPTELEKIDTLTADSRHVVEVFITCNSSTSSEWGVFKRTLVVGDNGGTVTIDLENADVDKTSSGLSCQSIDFTVNGGDIDIDGTGIAATTINWNSTYEIITKSSE
jgi:hypothetical protein